MEFNTGDFLGYRLNTITIYKIILKMVFTNELKKVFMNDMIIGVSWVWVGIKK